MLYCVLQVIGAGEVSHSHTRLRVGQASQDATRDQVLPRLLLDGHELPHVTACQTDRAKGPVSQLLQVLVALDTHLARL